MSQKTSRILYNTFQSWETVSDLFSDFYGQAQIENESKDIFVDDLQILVCKIIVWKPEFQANANEQLKLK